MATQSNSIDVFSNGSIKVTPNTASLTWQGYRVLHRSEGGRETPDDLPCVVPSINIAGIPFTRDMQLSAYHLANSQNAKFIKSKYRSTYRHDIAFCNYNGFEDPKDPRVDYVNMEDVGYPLPKLMKAIICTGNFFTGQISGNELIMTPGIDAIDGRKTMPLIEEIITKHWFYYATSGHFSHDVDEVWKVSHFPQGEGGPVLIPYILKEQARYPLKYFEPWNSNTLPDPLTIYSPK